MAGREKAVEGLITLLESNSTLKNAVEISLREASEPGISTLEEFYGFLNSILTHIPGEKELMPTVRQFYYILSKSPDDV
jgi:phosphatidylserine decarboxylase